MKRLVLILAAGLLFALPTSASAIEGNFLLSCAYDHTASDDPIVFPGSPGASTHPHDFFGTVGITAFTSTPQILGKPTTCAIGGETVGMWHPAIVKNGSLVHPYETSIYYRNNEAPNQPVYPFPTGLRFVQGDPHNHTPNNYAATYRCYSGGVNSVYIPATCGGSGFEESIYVPACWKGESLNPPDHHPLVSCTGAASDIRMPQVQFLLQWPGSAEGGCLDSDIDEGVSCGLTSHIDYHFAADPFVFAKIVERCLNAGIQCRVAGTGENNPKGTIYNNSASYPKPAVLTVAEVRGLTR